MSGGQPARVPSGARDAVVPPGVVRFAIQKNRSIAVHRRGRASQRNSAPQVTFSTSKTRRSGENLGDVQPVKGCAGKVCRPVQSRAAFQPSSQAGVKSGRGWPDCAWVIARASRIRVRHCL